ncbi:MAG: O-antigen ligase family protein [Candidatus Brocadiales bacterium]|nr:O-antigen ligase family protein [Candidatus Brocadiales bacterium]
MNAKSILQLLIVLIASYVISKLFVRSDTLMFFKLFIAVVVILIFFKVALSSPLEKLLILIVLSIPFPVFPNIGGKDMDSTTTMLIFVVFFAYASNMIFERKPILPERPFILPVMMLVIAYMLSFINLPAAALSNGIRNMMVLISCVLFFYMVINTCKDEETLMKMLDLITIICFLEVLVVLVQIFFTEHSSVLHIFASKAVNLAEKYEGRAHIRVSGTFGFDYEMAAEFFAINGLIQYFRIQLLKHSLKRVLYILCFVLTLFALISTGTRGGVVSMFAGIFIVMFIAHKHVNAGKNLVIFAFLGVFFFALLLLLKDYLPLFGVLYDRFAGTKIEGGVPDTRSRVWSQIIPGIMNKPFIGHGPYSIGKLRIFMDPHSMYLYYLFNVGIVGFIAAMSFFIQLIVSGYKALKESKSPIVSHALIMLFGATVVFLIDEIKIPWQRYSNFQQFIWFIFALLVSAVQLVKKQQKTDL